jgi:hypothetical protein
VTASFLAGSQRRLSWPLNYWNGLGALAAMGIPLLLSLAGSARSLLARAAAVAGLPLLVLCEYLTFSRGGAIAVAVALVVFLLFAGERLDKLASALVGAAGGAILVLGAHHRQALENGFTGHLAVLQGRSLLVAVVVTCLGAGLAQAGIAFAARHGTSPLQISRRTARIGLAVTLVALVAIGLGVGGASRLQHAWRDFKSTSGTGVTGNFAARYGSLAGNDRYQYWQVAVHQGAGHRLAGTGPGTFQLLWDPHASLYSPVLDAHSLYVQTLAEVGVVGLVLLVAFFLVLLGCAVRATMTRDQAARTRAASALAALVAFLVSAAVEWVWQLPVLPVVFMLLAAAVLAPPRRTASVRRTLAPHPARGEPEHPSRATAALRPALVVLAAACILGIGVPLAATGDVRSSQDAVQTGDLTAAVTDARSAVSVESGAAEPYLQLALVLELQHRLSPAIAAATHSIRNEPLNWASWLVLSRLQAEDGHPTAALTAYRRARALNPRSPLFSPA